MLGSLLSLNVFGISKTDYSGSNLSYFALAVARTSAVVIRVNFIFIIIIKDIDNSN